MLYTLYRVYSFVKPYCSHSFILFSDLILHGSAVGLAKGKIFIIYKGNIQALTPHFSIVPRRVPPSQSQHTAWRIAHGVTRKCHS